MMDMIVQFPLAVGIFVLKGDVLFCAVNEVVNLGGQDRCTQEVSIQSVRAAARE